jgi:hypothetical protein
MIDGLKLSLELSLKIEKGKGGFVAERETRFETWIKRFAEPARGSILFG